jgi:hypothetical protein
MEPLKRFLEYSPKLESGRPKPGGMEETLERGRGPPRAVAPLERERERVFNQMINKQTNKHFTSQHVKESTDDSFCTATAEISG